MRVFYKKATGDSEIKNEDFDTVLVATGRYPDTKLLGCESIYFIKELNIKMDKSGKIIVNEAE